MENNNYQVIAYYYYTNIPNAEEMVPQHLAFCKSIGVDIANNPDLVGTEYKLLSAAWFWSKNGLNKLADGGASDAVVTSITKRVNGGTIGLADRIKHFNEYYKLLA